MAERGLSPDHRAGSPFCERSTGFRLPWYSEAGDHPYHSPRLVPPREPYAFGSAPTTSGDRASTDRTQSHLYQLGLTLETAALLPPTSERYSTVFDSANVPNLPLGAYLNRLVKYMVLEDYHAGYASYYLDRVLIKQAIRLCSSNVHRLAAAAFLITVKFIDDDTYSNDFYAQVFGLNLVETNTVERNFLRSLEYDLWDTGAQNINHFLSPQRTL